MNNALSAVFDNFAIKGTDISTEPDTLRMVYWVNIAVVGATQIELAYHLIRIDWANITDKAAQITIVAAYWVFYTITQALMILFYYSNLKHFESLFYINLYLTGPGCLTSILMLMYTDMLEWDSVWVDEGEFWFTLILVIKSFGQIVLMWIEKKRFTKFFDGLGNHEAPADKVANAETVEPAADDWTW